MDFKQADELEFWLPSNVLADEDLLMDTKFRSPDSISSRLLFPNVGSGPFANVSALSSPGKSVVDSIETVSEEDVHLLSELTRQLAQLDGHKIDPTRPTQEKNWVHSGSPQSTLLHVESFSGWSTGSSNGSPNGPTQVSSPPTTPLASKFSSWDLIYRAAGFVEGPKSTGAGGLTSSNPAASFQRHGSFSTLPPQKSSIHSSVYPNYHVRGVELFGREMYGAGSVQVRNLPTNLNNAQKMGGFAGLPGGWPPCVNGGHSNLLFRNRDQQQPLGPGVGGCGFHSGGDGVGHGYGYGAGNRVRVGNVVKSERVGTGVFLPRRYDEKSRSNSYCNTVDSHQKSGNSNTYLPKNVPVMAMNLNNKSFFTEDYDALLTRRMSVATLQRKTTAFNEGPIHHEICLPQEWTY